MKKNVMLIALGAIVVLMSACGSSKKVSDDYYDAPTKKITEKKREVREVDRLAAEKTDRLRAVGTGNDMDEKYARREALRDGQTILAGYLETAIIELTNEHHKKAQANDKKFSETSLDDYVETSVAQKISTKMVGLPEVYDKSDGTVSVYVCVELTTTTEQVLGELHDQMTRDEVLAADYDKQKFIEDNKKRLEELREKVK